MNTGEILALKAYIAAIRKMLDAIRELEVMVPSTVVMWVQQIETIVETEESNA